MSWGVLPILLPPRQVKEELLEWLDAEAVSTVSYPNCLFALDRIAYLIYERMVFTALRTLGRALLTMSRRLEVSQDSFVAASNWYATATQLLVAHELAHAFVQRYSWAEST